MAWCYICSVCIIRAQKNLGVKYGRLNVLEYSKATSWLKATSLFHQPCSISQLEMFVGCVPKALNAPPTPSLVPVISWLGAPASALLALGGSTSGMDWLFSDPCYCGPNCVPDKETFLGVARHYLENSNHSTEEKVIHLEPLEEKSRHLKWGQRADTVKTTAETYLRTQREFLASVSRGTSCVLGRKKDVNICFFIVNLKEVDEPGLRAQLCHLVALCPWASCWSSEPQCLSLQNRLHPTSGLLCGSLEIMYVKGIVKCLDILMFS